jgi:hypothetical protein
MKLKLTNQEIRDALNIETPEFPKYVTQIINLANQNAQGTRPKVVGQMSDLIQQYTGKTLPEWETWYVKEKPDAIRMATDKVLDMVENLKDAMDAIDRDMISRWVRDLVIVKTFLGMKFQEAILKKGAEIKGEKYRLAKPSEESQNIDGYIGSLPVSIKPHTYRVKKALNENISVKIVYYEKLKDGIEVDYTDIIEGMP